MITIIHEIPLDTGHVCVRLLNKAILISKIKKWRCYMSFRKSSKKVSTREVDVRPQLEIRDFGKSARVDEQLQTRKIAEGAEVKIQLETRDDQKEE